MWRETYTRGATERTLSVQLIGEPAESSLALGLDMKRGDPGTPETDVKGQERQGVPQSAIASSSWPGLMLGRKKVLIS